MSTNGETMDLRPFIILHNYAAFVNYVKRVCKRSFRPLIGQIPGIARSTAGAPILETLKCRESKLASIWMKRQSGRFKSISSYHHCSQTSQSERKPQDKQIQLQFDNDRSSLDFWIQRARFTSSHPCLSISHKSDHVTVLAIG